MRNLESDTIDTQEKSKEYKPLIEFNTPFLNDYLQMVDDSESPRIFHIWSAIFAAASAMGRRCWFPMGTFNIYPNHYILLIGTPGTRKTTAASLAKKIVTQSTGVRFAPKDTGFQRQGLIMAFLGATESENKEYMGAVELGSRENSIMSLTQIDEITNTPDEDMVNVLIHEEDKHHLALVASEFSQVIGQGNNSMLDFLGERYDGEGIEYQTKYSAIKMKSTLMNLLSCTTPTSLSIALPPQAGGQGFLSRIILVYGARKYKEVPRPKAPPLEVIDRVKNCLDSVYYKISGPFSETPEAEKYCIDHYGYKPDITDSRFAYYSERRAGHLTKLAMVLAATQGSTLIQKADYEEAHRILVATEKGMPDALGEFGMNPLAMLKQSILEELRVSQGPMTMETILAMFHRDARSHEITEVVSDLVKMGQCTTTQTATGPRLISAKFTKQSTEDAMMNLLSQK